MSCLAVAGCSSGGDPPRAERPSGAGSSGIADAALATFYDQQPQWKSCRDGFECAKVRVPVDYADPTGDSLQLSVVRLPAAGSDRLGSLLLNPGGPGVSGIGYARAAGTAISPAVRRRFDIVGFDPRGVAASAPIRCLSDAQTDEWSALDFSPDDAGEEAALVAMSRRFAARCAVRNGKVLGHVGTRDSARDLDVLRGVLGDEKLNFLGKSYGTYLGAIYAETFPARVGRLVLDGVVDPAADASEQARTQAVGFEQALASFVDDCLTRSRCPLSGDRNTALAEVSDILDRADRSPLDARRPVTQSLTLLGIAYAMYEPSLWTVLREGLAQADRGDGETLLVLADSYLDRNAKGHYRSNTNDAFTAITCLDRPETSDVAELRARARELGAVAPRFGAYIAWELTPCGQWSVPAEGDAAPVHATGAAPILVVGTTRDPATPYASARKVAEQLDSARLLTYAGDGHTAYRQGSGCIDRAVDAYLVQGRLPAVGTRCR